ncbi:MAG: vWA domain-containing protein [Bdellovibrionota bacterium]|nr:MAG: vWA domain-containing protein [Bdellovibrionota bacterium]
MRLLLLLALVLCLSIAGGCTRQEKEPPPKPDPSVTLRIVHGPELRSFLSSRRESFYLTEPKLIDGTKVKLDFVSELGSIAAELLARGEIKSEGWLAPSTSLVNFVNSSIKNLGAPQRECVPLFSTPLVVAVHPSTIETFHSSGQEFSWNELIQRELHFRGEEGAAAARVSFSHATPRLSTTGLSALIQIAYFSVPAEEKTVNVNWLNSEHTRTMLARHESLVSDYSVSESVLLNRVAQPEPLRVRFAVTTEQQLLLFNGSQTSPQTRLLALYPLEGSYWDDYQLCTSAADWVTPAHRAAMQLFVSFLQQQESQQAAAKLGYRPSVSDKVELPTENSGVRFSLPAKNLPPVSGEVVAELVKSWPDLRRPAALAIVLDTSGSMEGLPLDSAKHELRALVARMSRRDLKALVTFSSQPRIDSPFIDDPTKFIPLLDRANAVGGSALYDAVRNGVELITSSQLQSYRKTLLVITDGDDKNSQSSLTSLVDFLQDKFGRTDISLIVIGLAGEGRDYTDLKEVVRATNGVFRESTPSDLPRLFVELASSIQGLA